ncbi:MAG TPA: PgaD family protein [Chthoniobacter sp.]|nr:PgaD family protein [Chthoniobacter sp.]
MKPPSKHRWPPLITHAEVPWYIRARNGFLTLLAWLTMAYMLRLAIVVLWDYLSHPIFELTHAKEHNWALAWQRLSLFVYAILALVIWITVWGVKRRKVLRRNFDPRVTPSLPLEEHAASLGLDPREVERWRQWRSVTVQFEGHRIVGARPGGPKETQQ